MNLVNEENDVFRFDHIIHNIFKAFFELTAVFRACDKRRHRQRDDAFILKQERHLAGCNTLRKPFGDSGLSDARLAEENWIVLRTAREDLNNAVNLCIAVNDRIKPPCTRGLDQIAPEFFD